MAYYRRRTPVKPKAKPKRTYRRKAPPKATFERRVKTVLNKQAETKLKVINLSNDSILGTGLQIGTLGFTVNNILASVAMTQGTQQGQRIGNQVSNAHLNVKGFVKTMPNSATNLSLLPFEVHILFYKVKSSIIATSDLLKQYPANVEGPITGHVETTLYPYNTNKYTIKKRLVFKMRPLSYNSGTPSSLINGQQSNAPAFRRFGCKIPISKVLKYSDGGIVPNNDWCAMSAFIIDGSGEPLPATDVRAVVYMDASLRWDDY